MGKFFIALRRLVRLLDPALDHLQIRHDQFQIDNRNIPLRVRGPLHMDHILVVKTADHMDNGVCLPDIRKKLVAQPFAPARAFDQSGNVHKFHNRRGFLQRLVQFRQIVQPFIRYRHHAHVGIDGTEGVIRALGPGVGDRVEQSGLSHVGQSHNP